MKRQTQLLGVRNWYADAFISLQEEPLKVIDGFFAQYGSFVLSGCEVTANGSMYDVAPGLVVLEGSGAGNTVVKVVVPFAGVSTTALPLYLTLGCEIETDLYNDGKVKPIAHIYRAVATTVRPAGSCVAITKQGCVRFTDAIQDAAHRFITDAERNAWNKARQDVETYSMFDYVVDSEETLAALHQNPLPTSVLIKKGTYHTDKSIVLSENVKRIVGQPGNTIINTGSINPAIYCKGSENEFSMQGINIVLEGSASIGFQNGHNLTNCTCVAGDGFLHRGFDHCENLTSCTAEGAQFWGCVGMTRCVCKGSTIDGCTFVNQCTSSGYRESFSGSSRAATYQCADTLNGGWNRMLEP